MMSASYPSFTSSPMEPNVAADPLETICRDLLLTIGENPDRPGLADTPARWARWWREFIAQGQANHTDTAFETVRADQMIVVRGIEVWSLCEHHLLPFRCEVTIGVITGPKILGLSKYARIARKHAGRLQLQERLVEDIAAHLQQATGTYDVAVVAKGEHLCMTMRGVRTPAMMISSATHGLFRDDARARAEFLGLAGLS